LANLAKADAKHDLPEIVTIENTNNKGNDAFNMGLPEKSDNSILKEEDTFFSVIVEPKNTSNKKLNEYLHDNISENPGTDIFKIGFGTTIINQYTASKFLIHSRTNPKGKKVNPTVEEYEKHIGNDSIIVVDFNQHGFIETLKKDTKKKSDFTCHYVLTEEVVNDPAGKTNVYDKNIFNATDPGIQLKSYVQEYSSSNGACYTAYDENSVSLNNLFFSRYNFSLSPVKEIITKQSKKFITSLSINWNQDTKPYQCTIEDSKGENSVNTVKGYLLKMIHFLHKGGKFVYEFVFNYNSKFQQKRGGDWFQVLCCHDIKNRKFKQILPNSGGDIPNKGNLPVFFVSHDQIAVSYALLMGVNVIYLDYYGYVFVFKNTNDETARNEKIEKLIFGNLKNINTSIITTVTQYNEEIRNVIINDANENINDIFGDIEKKLNQLLNMNKTDLLKNFQKVITEELNELFIECVKYMFIVLSYTDVDEEIKMYNKNIRVIQPAEYNDKMDKQIQELNKAYTVLNSVYYKIGRPASGELNTRQAITKIKNWIDTNIKTLDVYNSAKILFTNTRDVDNITVDIRLLNYNYVDMSKERMNDFHIFLPYIEQIDDNFKKKIIDIMNIAAIICTKYKPNVDFKRGRFSGISSNELFFNKVVNLIVETRAFLKIDNSPPDNSVDDKISIHTSTIVTELDKKGIDIMKRGILYNGVDEYNILKKKEESDTIPGYEYTLDDRIDRTKFQGGFLPFRNSDSPQKINVKNIVNEVSLKQVSWTLLSYNTGNISGTITREKKENIMKKKKK